MTTANTQIITISSRRGMSEEDFRTAVKNSLSKMSNLTGLDRFDRDELMDLSDSDHVLHHWRDLVRSAATSNEFTEWAWGQHIKAATRACASAWSAW